MAKAGDRISWRALVPFLCLLAAAGLLFWPLVGGRRHLVPFHVLAGDPALSGIDTGADRPDWRFFDESPLVTFYAEKALAAEQMHAGELPLWNPFSGIGVPLLANAQCQPFAPLFLPFMVHPSPWTYSWALILQLLFGGVGAALLLRALGGSLLSQCSAALLFAFNPYALDYLVYSDVWAYVWLPWVFLAAERAVRGTGAWRLVALLLACAAASGHVEVAFFGAVSAFAYAALRLLQERKWKGSSARWAGLPFLTVLLSAWWLVPFAEYVAHCTSARYASNTCYPYHPSACFIIGSEVFWPPLLVVLVLVGFTASSARRHLLALLPGAVWSLLMMFPFPLPLQQAATGDLLSGRYGRAMMWFVLVVSASLGLDALARGIASAPWRLVATAGTLGWLVMGLWLRQPTLAQAATRNWVPLLGPPFESSTALVVLSLLVLVLMVLPAALVRPALRAWATALAVVAGLLPFHPTFDIYWNRSEPALVQQVADARGKTAGRMWFACKDEWKSLPPNLGAFLAVRDVRYSDPFAPWRLSLLGWAQGPHDDLFQQWDPERALFLGVERAWFLAPQDGKNGQTGMLRDWPARGPAGRALWLEEAKLVGGDREALADALKGRDWERTVFLEGGPAPLPAAPASGAGPATITLDSDRAMTCRFGVAAPGAGWLVVRDLCWPGWRATLDGRRADMRPADGVFRAVYVPQGRHVVAFSYVPASFWLGTALSLLTLVAMAAVGRVGRR